MAGRNRNNQYKPLIHLIQYFARQSKTSLVIFAYLAVCFTGIIDYVTGAEISFSIFYVIPVLIVALSLSRKQGLMISGLAALIWLTADLLTRPAYSHPAIPWWNAAVRFSFFAIISTFASALKKMYEHQENLARTDFLTGTANRRLLFETAQARFYGSDADNRPFTVIYIDLDNFKKINDDLGHAAGDAILQSVGEAIKKCLRKTDIVARIGGDEFVILLPGTGAEDSKGVANKIRNSVANLANGQQWKLTITMGIATFHRPPGSIDEMIARADELMYQAKDSGKNTIRYGTDH